MAVTASEFIAVSSSSSVDDRSDLSVYLYHRCTLLYAAVNIYQLELNCPHDYHQLIGAVVPNWPICLCTLCTFNSSSQLDGQKYLPLL